MADQRTINKHKEKLIKNKEYWAMENKVSQNAIDHFNRKPYQVKGYYTKCE